VRRWEALADGVCDAAVAIMLEQRKAEAAQDAAWMTKQMDKVSRGLTVLNDDLADRKWCVEDAFSLADIAVGCMLAYVTMRFAKQIDLAEHYPNLHRLYLCLQARPSFAGSEPSPY
jgi:glutathione S-transferase